MQTTNNPQPTNEPNTGRAWRLENGSFLAFVLRKRRREVARGEHNVVQEEMCVFPVATAEPAPRVPPFSATGALLNAKRDPVPLRARKRENGRVRTVVCVHRFDEGGHIL